MHMFKVIQARWDPHSQASLIIGSTFWSIKNVTNSEGFWTKLFYYTLSELFEMNIAAVIK